MKSIILLSLMLSSTLVYSANLPANCADLAAQVNAKVVSTAVNDMDQNQTECTFNVSVNGGETEIDQVCPLDLFDVEQATYIDPTCSVVVGQRIDSTTTQNFSTRDMQSRGLFYWIDLGGYQSQIVFPNYGK